MIPLTLDIFPKFNAFGLREICSYNRNILMNYNSLFQNDLKKYVKNKIIENHEIIIPSYILKDERYFFFKYKNDDI